jgi:hypothetical protein
MSQDTLAPATEAPAAPPAKDTGERKPNTIGERRAAFLDKVNRAIAAGAEPSPTPETAAPVETPAETPAPTETAGETPAGAPPKVEGETQKQYAHRIAAAQIATQRAEAKALAESERAKASDAKAAELQAKLDAAAKDPKVALALAGMNPVSFAEAMRDGKITATEVQEAKLELPPEVLELIEQGKAAKRKAELDARAAEEAAVRSENLKKVSDVVNTADFQAEFPALAGSVDVSERMLLYLTHEMDRTGKEPDFQTVAKTFNDSIVKEATQIMMHAGARKLLLGNAELRAAILAELQPATEQSVPATAPAKPSEKGSPSTTITNKVASKIPSRTSRGTSSADLAARINSTILGR